jgi:hypothetical protein
MATRPDSDDDEAPPSERDEHDEHDHREILDPKGPCMSCGAPNARIWHTPDGPARLCPTCAVLNGVGCP